VQPFEEGEILDHNFGCFRICGAGQDLLPKARDFVYAMTCAAASIMADRQFAVP